jgi:hypothetical protein
MKLIAAFAVLLLMLAPGARAVQTAPTVVVYKTPTCGCCAKWVDHMKAAGFRTVTHDVDDLAPHKARLGVPFGMGSCHTAEVNGYLVEGHVPAADVRRLLTETPRAKGLVAPGMPASAPGMDQPGKIPYEVFLVRRDGSTVVYARH